MHSAIVMPEAGPDVTETKKCTRCLAVKPIDQFRTRSDHGTLRSACKRCDNDTTNKNKSKKAAGRLAELQPPQDDTWTPAELSRLLELHRQGFSPRQIGTVMNIKGRRVQGKLFALKLLKPPRTWTASEDSMIRAYYQAAGSGPFDLVALAKALGRGKSRVCDRARELGLTDKSNSNKERQTGWAKAGKRDDLGGVYFRSSWEANYARYLNLLKQKGEIKGWDFEQVRWTFHAIQRGVRSYLCDFRVFMSDGRTEFHEVKGWMSPSSKTALTRMAKYYPDVRIVVIDQVFFRELRKTLAPSIKGWEGAL